jgi:hypothetical protein
MKLLRQLWTEQKLLKILLLEIKVKEAVDLKTLRLVKLSILNSFWDKAHSLGTAKGKILSFKPLRKNSREVNLEDKKMQLLLILQEFKTAYENKLKNI